MAEGITAEQFNECIPAREALSLVCEATQHWDTAVSQIVERVIAGLVLAYAEHAQEFHVGDALRDHERFHITPSIWANGMTGQLASGLSLWRSNDMSIRYVLQGPRPHVCVFKFFGIRFDRLGIQKLLGPEEDKTAHNAPPVGSNKGGRPRKEFWDDLLLAMFERLWAGEFKPDTQADIERAMLDWASEKGHDLSESSVKAPARKLLRIYQK